VSNLINLVFNSYESINEEDQVIVQKMVLNVSHSGVIFTHDPVTGSKYLTLNWVEGEDTTLVTSGKKSKVTQLYFNSPSDIELSTEMKKIRSTVVELLEIYGGIPLDIEYAISQEKNEQKLWILQVRPLNIKISKVDEYEVYNSLKRIDLKIDEYALNHPYMLGTQKIFASMPDWNPAEIIGTRPRPLAFSLYKEIISNEIWAYQRYNYGYRDLRSAPLVWDLEGIPYVDVRASFNSFIPASLENEIASKLVGIYLEKLSTNAELHDKVEFEVVLSCYFPGIEETISRDEFKVLTNQEKDKIIISLSALTKKIILNSHETWAKDREKIEKLILRNKKIMSANISLQEKIFWLIEDCKRFGTLPFAGLARAAFISVQFLKKFVELNIISQEIYDRFMASINTVTSELIEDRSKLSNEKFMEKYGHLRPGTYDICSDRYDSNPELYFGNRKNEEPKREPIKLNEHINSNLFNKYVAESLIGEIDIDTLENFFMESIRLREYFKFIYTKNISDSLELIKDLGYLLDIDTEDLSYIDYNEIKKISNTTVDLKKSFKNSIEIGRNKYLITKSIILPPIISESNQVWYFTWPEISPNFITDLTVTANITVELNKEIKNKIVLIESADPGFDWIFTCGIKGLVTAYGGANSHMAIRANELHIPAAIGVGEAFFKEIMKKKILTLDCLKRQIFVNE
jgi:phosphohistidine swiveling domain-containing protein